MLKIAERKLQHDMIGQDTELQVDGDAIPTDTS